MYAFTIRINSHTYETVLDLFANFCLGGTQKEKKININATTKKWDQEKKSSQVLLNNI